jgi:hypothetical protein
LFSKPAAAEEHGYRDGWVGDTTYRYFGAWSGSGDMLLDGVNRTILDRSPNLLLLTKSGDGWRFEGYFSCDQYETQRTVRDGREFSALVFLLVRKWVILPAGHCEAHLICLIALDEHVLGPLTIGARRQREFPVACSNVTDPAHVTTEAWLKFKCRRVDLHKYQQFAWMRSE